MFVFNHKYLPYIFSSKQQPQSLVTYGWTTVAARRKQLNTIIKYILKGQELQ